MMVFKNVRVANRCKYIPSLLNGYQLTALNGVFKIPDIGPALLSRCPLFLVLEMMYRPTRKGLIAEQPQ